MRCSWPCATGFRLVISPTSVTIPVNTKIPSGLSWPGLSRPSTSSFITSGQDVDARDKPGQDEFGLRALVDCKSVFIERFASTNAESRRLRDSGERQCVQRGHAVGADGSGPAQQPDFIGESGRDER